MSRRPARRVDISINMAETGANISKLILCKILNIDITELLVIDGEFGYIQELKIRLNDDILAAYKHIRKAYDENLSIIYGSRG